MIVKIDRKFWHDTINLLRIFEERSKRPWLLPLLPRNLLYFSAVLQDPVSAIICKAVFDADFKSNDAGLPHNQCAQIERRLQRSCRGLVEFAFNDNYTRRSVTLIHRTVLEYVTKSPHFEQMLSEVDGRLLRDLAVAVMAMHLRLITS